MDLETECGGTVPDLYGYDRGGCDSGSPGQRIINTTAITCEGNIIKVNGERIGSPFTIKAIGSQSLLYGALERAGSWLDQIRNDGNTARVTRVDNITISRYTGVISYEYLHESN